MVNSASALGRNGIHDWLLLRASALVIVCYVLYVTGFVVTAETLTYPLWRNFFSTTLTRIFTSLTLMAVLVHAWIGLWQVLTDYCQRIGWRLLLQLLVVLVLLSDVIFGYWVIWGRS